MTRSDSAPSPAYDELPRLEELGARHSWDHFGRDDELGTMGRVTDAKVIESLAEAVDGRRINLTLPVGTIDPPFYGREAVELRFLQTDRNTWDDRLDSLYPQGGSQWDGLRHVRAREFGYYGGRLADPPDLGAEIGIQRWAERGILTRGVLLDVDAHFRRAGAPLDALEPVAVTAQTLRRTAQEQGVELREGDVLCVRFGWLAAYRAMSRSEREHYAASRPLLRYAGLAADEEMAAYLWDNRLAGVALDNPAAEVSPGDPRVGSLHRRLIPLLGFAIGELFDFEELASACAADGRWSFLLVSVPLDVVGGVGSPANAVAVR